MAEKRRIADVPTNLQAPVWQHFGFYAKTESGTEVLDKTNAICKICKTSLVYRTGTTSNLKKHLVNKHPHVHLKEKSSASASSLTQAQPGPSDPKKQKSLPEIVKQKAEKYSDNSKRFKDISRAIAIFMAKDLRPFSVVDDDGFEQLVKCLDDKYTLPSRTYFSEKLIPNLYSEVKLQVLERLKTALALSLTTDGWTSRATESYVTFTAHFITTPDYKLDSFMLQTRQINESHTAENLSALINSVLVDWDLIREGEKPAITTDNAANIVNAVKLCGMHHVRCLAHVLNLCVHKGLKNVTVLHMLKKVRRIVGFFHRSSTAAARLKSTAIGLEMQPRKLVQDVETRWNSTFDMLDSFAYMRTAVEATLKLKDLKFKDKDSMLTDEEQDLAAELCRLLRPFKTATKALCSEKFPTVSLIYNMKQMLLKHLQAGGEDCETFGAMKAAMSDDLQSRYVDQESYLIECSMVDPRFKTVEFASDKQRNQAFSVIRSKMMILGTRLGLVKSDEVQQVGPSSDPAESDDEQPPLPTLFVKENSDSDENNNTSQNKMKDQPSNSSALGELFGAFITKIDLPAENTVDIELASYKRQPAASIDSNPVEWWGENIKKYPLLSKVACEYLVVQGTSVAAERVFSTAGDIVSAQRARLNSDKVDMLIFLKKNLK